MSTNSLNKHVHIIGICGTFMGSLAQLAQAAGYKVSGCDSGVYPPMSTQLEQAGIELIDGFDIDQLELKPDIFIIGNAISRGNPLLEAILDRGLPYTSGPHWLADCILQNKWVLAVAGTHGKTTTASMLAWILEYAGFQPGFLIGGVPENFGISARLGQSDFFVVEADEYDTAFFDKRSKFVHYRPHTLIINNLEFDHADIFDDLAAIETQFHHLIRTVPQSGCIVRPHCHSGLDRVLERGCWSEVQSSGTGVEGGDSLEGDATWDFSVMRADQSQFSVYFQGGLVAQVDWALSGLHNISNAVHAIAAARSIGIDPSVSAGALNEFKSVKRRMERVGQVAERVIYDDFAHHPTALATTLQGVRASIADDVEIVLAIEPRSNTMRMGVHKDSLRQSVAEADAVYWYQDQALDWSMSEYVRREDGSAKVFSNIDSLVSELLGGLPEKAVIIVMSNGAFFGLPKILLSELEKAAQQQRA